MKFYDSIGEELNIGDCVIYLKNTRTGSSTVRKCKYVGVIIGFTKANVRIQPLSEPDRYEINWEGKNKSVSIESKDIIIKTDNMID